jgi:hypothetical protein
VYDIKDRSGPQLFDAYDGYTYEMTYNMEAMIEYDCRACDMVGMRKDQRTDFDSVIIME